MLTDVPQTDSKHVAWLGIFICPSIFLMGRMFREAAGHTIRGAENKPDPGVGPQPSADPHWPACRLKGISVVGSHRDGVMC